MVCRLVGCSNGGLVRRHLKGGWLSRMLESGIGW